MSKDLTKNNASYQSISSVQPVRIRMQDENPYSSKLFLIIDNVPEMQRALSMTLSSFGANKVEYANRASDAMSKLARFDFDVVLCDFDLGNGYDGLHLLEEIKQKNLIKQSCVFMIVTAESRVERVVSAAELAPDAYLLKPFSGEQLRVRLEKAMRRRGALKSVDTFIQKNEYLAAITECDRRIAERDEFLLDFMKLKGSLSLQIGDHLGAESLYKEVLQIKALPWAKLGLGKALVGAKRFDEARPLFEEVLDENSRVMEAYDWLARIQEAKHEFGHAKQTLQTATELSPVVIRRQKKLGETAMQEGDFATAQTALQKTIDLAKYSSYRCPDDYAALARAQVAAGELSAAAQTVSNVRREFRGDPVADWTATVMESSVATASGQPHRGRELLEAAIEKYRDLSPMLNESAQLELVHACYKSGREDVAVRVVQQLVKNNHDNEALLDRVGYVYQQIGRAEDGKKLIEDNVQTVVDLNNEAVRLAQAGKLEEAVAMFNKAVDELPTNIQISLNAVNAILALVHRKGWHESFVACAHGYLERVRKADPANVKFQRLLVAYRTLIEKHGKQQWML